MDLRGQAYSIGSEGPLANSRCARAYGWAEPVSGAWRHLGVLAAAGAGEGVGGCAAPLSRGPVQGSEPAGEAVAVLVAREKPVELVPDRAYDRRCRAGFDPLRLLRGLSHCDGRGRPQAPPSWTASNHSVVWTPTAFVNPALRRLSAPGGAVHRVPFVTANPELNRTSGRSNLRFSQANYRTRLCPAHKGLRCRPNGTTLDGTTLAPIGRGIRAESRRSANWSRDPAT